MMKHNTLEMEKARKEAIHILDTNPECTENDFKHIRPIIENDEINIRPLTTKAFSTSANVNISPSSALVYSLRNTDGTFKVGTITDLSFQLGLTYNQTYGICNGMSQMFDYKTNIIDVIPSVYGYNSCVVLLKGVLIENITYGEACVKYNIHTSDLWEVMVTGQPHKGFTFECGGSLNDTKIHI